jgi:trehalose 6-phosphate phosphatase
VSELLRDIEPIRPLLARSPFAVLSDIDGTLAPIVEDPDAAAVSLRAQEALSALIERGVGVGLITGRALEKAREMAGLPGAMYAANHGLSIDVGDGVETRETLREWVTKARALLPTFSHLAGIGIGLEDKGPIIALHYRRAPDESRAKAAIEAATAEAVAAGFRVQEGRKVVEIRPPIDVNKGTAAVDLARRLKARAILCMGDDLTDVDMFEGVRSLREEGVESIVIGVASREIDEAVLEAADYSVDGVEGVEWLLEEIISALPGAAR